MKTIDGLVIRPKLIEGEFFGFNYSINYNNFIQKDDDWSHFLWILTINNETLEFKTGQGLSKRGSWNTVKPDTPTVEQILHCILLDSQASEMTFKGFCSTFGYDSEYRSAFEIYIKCQDNGTKLKKALGSKYNSIQSHIESLEL